MLDKNKRVHRPERLKGHDYSRPGCYFITLTTRVRGKDIFCSIEGKREAEAPVGPAPLGRPIPRKQPDFPKFPLIRLTPVGAVVQELIEKIPAVYRDVHIDCYVIMPDHVHLLLWLGEPLADGIDIPGNDGRRSFLEGGDGPARGPGPAWRSGGADSRGTGVNRGDGPAAPPVNGPIIGALPRGAASPARRSGQASNLH